MEGQCDGPSTSSGRITTYCCVPQCKNYDREGLRFHHFPKEKALKNKWEIALKMGKAASASMRVCSDHFDPSDYFPGQKKFHRLKKDVVPSQNLPSRYHDLKETDEQKKKKRERFERAQHRALLVPVSQSCHEETHEESSENGPEPPQENLAEPPTIPVPERPKLRHVDTQTDGSPILRILTDKSKLYTFSGLYSFDLLDTITMCVSDIHKDSKTNKKLLPLRERVLLTFVKLKLNLSFAALEPLFGVSQSTCSNYFKNMVPLLAIVMESVIPWPTQEEIRTNLPIAFHNFRITRVVLDCAETPVERSKCIRCRILTYSHYKKGHTVKFKVGVAPSGLITSLSKCYGGRASDKLITNESHVLNKCDYMDGVMVDKGFAIEGECLERHLILHRPPFLAKKQQLSRTEALTSAEIARARVHVERVIQRIREFEFIGTKVRWSLLPYFEPALKIASGMVNLGSPVLNIDKFL